MSAEELRRLYRSVHRLRRTEETLAELYREQEMRTPTHFGIGQEAVASGVCEALKRDDVVYSHHRCHNHYLAKGGSIEGLAAELYGRETGCSRGRGGSVHLTARDKGFMVSSAIVGETVAVATGSALAFKMDGVPRIAVTFFGEATCEEGIIYECLNYASIRRLPVFFVCENNLYSTESPLSVRQPAGTDLCERVRTFKIPAERVDGNDVAAVYAAARRALDGIRGGEGPFFLECMTYRWREHVGPLYDYEMGRTYRSRAELEAWMARCPVKLARRRLLDERAATEGEIAGWEGETEREIAAAVSAAKAAPAPSPSELFENVY
ncbi:MAG: thiamine pyrophosphate-dependent dehydrogenase E1 component subunit alpha [Alphaproteobacteria bacterium]